MGDCLFCYLAMEQSPDGAAFFDKGANDMQVLDANGVLVLNSLVYKIYSIKDEREMRNSFLEGLKLMIDFDAADFYLARDDENEGLTDPVALNCDYISGNYDELDYSRGILYSGKSICYRETDIIDDQRRKQSPYYQAVYKPNNWHFSMQIIFAKMKQFLGVVTLYRSIGKDDFSYEDIFTADLLREHMSLRLAADREERRPENRENAVDHIVEKYALTKREREVLLCIIQGENRESICENLAFSENTLKKHMSNIYKKIGVNNRIQLLKTVMGS